MSLMANEASLPRSVRNELRRLRNRVADLEKALPFEGRRLRNFRAHLPFCAPNAMGYCGCPDENPVSGEVVADLICSDVSAGRHKPVIDIDFPCRLVESSPGKHHLYVDVEVEHSLYLRMLDSMAAAGVVETGYAQASRSRGYSAVRHPERPKRRAA